MATKIDTMRALAGAEVGVAVVTEEMVAFAKNYVEKEDAKAEASAAKKAQKRKEAEPILAQIKDLMASAPDQTMKAAEIAEILQCSTQKVTSGYFRYLKADKVIEKVGDAWKLVIGQ